MTEINGQKGFWTTLPGLIRSVAALITAGGGLVAVLYSTGVLGEDSTSNSPAPTEVDRGAVPDSRPYELDSPEAAAPPALEGWLVLATYEGNQLTHPSITFHGSRPSEGTINTTRGPNILWKEHPRLHNAGRTRLADLAAGERIQVLELDDFVAGNGVTLLLGKARLLP